MVYCEKYNFKYGVDVIYDSLTYLSGISLRDFFLDPKSCATVFKKGRKIFYNIFGLYLPIPTVSCPSLSYGHLSCLGAQVQFPEKADPSVRPFISCLDEGIHILKKELDPSKNELYIYYVNLYKYLVEEFPNEKISFSGFGNQGPLTTAVLMRGQDFFFDIYDEPEKTKEFLNLVTQSIVNFIYYIRKVNGKPSIEPIQGYLSDDFSSLVPPDLWPEFVIPFWELYYQQITTGVRNIHVENLTKKHLKHLETCKINFYDPSISNLISATDIKNTIKIPFRWLLAEYKLSFMTDDEIRTWIVNSLESGVDYIHTEIGQMICESGSTDKIIAFVNIAESLMQMNK